MPSAVDQAEQDSGERQNLDELDEQPGETHDAAQDTQTPQKRGRGRPKGSRNKTTVLEAPSTSTAAAAGSSTTTVKKRGRPPKEKKDDDEPAPKRQRGRPRKNPKPEDSGEPAPKKKRGRPKKTAAA